MKHRFTKQQKNLIDLAYSALAVVKEQSTEPAQTKELGKVMQRLDGLRSPRKAELRLTRRA